MLLFKKQLHVNFYFVLFTIFVLCLFSLVPLSDWSNVSHNTAVNFCFLKVSQNIVYLMARLAFCKTSFVWHIFLVMFEDFFAVVTSYFIVQLILHIGDRLYLDVLKLRMLSLIFLHKCHIPRRKLSRIRNWDKSYFGNKKRGQSYDSTNEVVRSSSVYRSDNILFLLTN